jgi:predicted Zn-ribbon and HTH transcriptional regulator
MIVNCESCGWEGSHMELYNEKCPRCASKNIYEKIMIIKN